MEQRVVSSGAYDEENVHSGDDRSLILRCLENDPEAYSLLLTRYRAPIFSFVVRMVRDRNTAEEITSEAFVRAFLALGKFDPQRKFSPWLYRIARNLAIDHLRRKVATPLSLEEAQETSGSWLESQIASERDRPDVLLERRERSIAVESALATLPEEFRTALYLRHFESKSYEEIAAIMDIPLGTVRSRMHRGRQLLREKLKNVL